MQRDIAGTAIQQGGNVKITAGSRATSALGEGQDKIDLKTQVDSIKIRSETLP